MRGRRLAVVALFALPLGSVLVGADPAAHAAPTLIASRPLSDPAAHELTLFFGGADESGRSLKSGEVEIVLDGDTAGAPLESVALSDWAAANAESNASWRPPLAVGLVYLWTEGVPSGLLEGLHAFFQRVPPRTTIYPTIYGRLRQGRARLSAADVGRLDELPYLEAYRPNLGEAVSLDVGDLAADAAPLRILLIVTDGRDFSDPKGQEPGDFGALGRRLRVAGITPLVVGFPPPDAADAAAAASNLRDLPAGAGGFLRVLDQVEDLENTLESLGQALGDARRVRVAEPFSWRLFAGTHRVSARLVVGGQPLGTDVGSVTVSGNSGVLAVAIAVVVVVALGLVAAVVARRRRRARDQADDEEGDAADEEEVVEEMHALIKRGVSPQRAVEELSRGRGSAVMVLVGLDPEILSDPRFPYFRTRPGRARVKEIQDILAKKAAARPALGATLADALAAAIKQSMRPESAADTLAARVTPDEAAAFAAMGLDELATALRDAAQRQPVLASPRARGAVVAVQDALRVRNASGNGVAVGWLVRAAGPGPRGETLRFAGPRTLVGRGATCQLRFDNDTTLTDEHAEILNTGSEFVIAPLAGAVVVEGRPVSGRHALSDGETIELGAGRFVFKSAVSLARAAAPSARPARPPARRRVPR